MKQIKKYDHESKIPISRRKLVRTQLKVTFGLIALATLALIVNEFRSTTYNIDIGFLTVLAFIYLIYEVFLFVTYKDIRKPKTDD